MITFYSLFFLKLEILLLLLCLEHLHWAISDPHLAVTACAAEYEHFCLFCLLEKFRNVELQHMYMMNWCYCFFVLGKFFSRNGEPHIDGNETRSFPC